MTKKLHRKLGDNKGEMAVKPRKEVKNFKQSKDIRESRGTRQTKLGGKKN